jgi:hypothetical protein
MIPSNMADSTCLFLPSVWEPIPPLEDKQQHMLQALFSSGYESEMTEIVGIWINTGLTE